MYKIEDICDNCNKHYAIITNEEDDPIYCVFCGVPSDVTNLDDDTASDEDGEE